MGAGRSRSEGVGELAESIRVCEDEAAATCVTNGFTGAQSERRSMLFSLVCRRYELEGLG